MHGHSFKTQEYLSQKLSYFSNKAYFSRIVIFISLFSRNKPYSKNKTIFKKLAYNCVLHEQVLFLCRQASYFQKISLLQKIRLSARNMTIFEIQK